MYKFITRQKLDIIKYTEIEDNYYFISPET